MKKTAKSVVISLIAFLIIIYIFQLLKPNVLNLLIYPLASSVICSLLVYHITSSSIVTFISLAINNVFLIFILIPLSSGLTYYHDTLRFIFSADSSHGIINYLEIFAALSLLIGLLTVKIMKLISRNRARAVFISNRTWKREFLS